MAIAWKSTAAGFLVLAGATVTGTFFLFDSDRKVVATHDVYEIVAGSDERVRMCAGGTIGSSITTQTVNEWVYTPDTLVTQQWYTYEFEGTVTNDANPTNAIVAVGHDYMTRVLNQTNALQYITTNRTMQYSQHFPVTMPFWYDFFVIEGRAYKTFSTNGIAWLGFDGYTASSFADGSANGTYYFWTRVSAVDYHTNANSYTLYERGSGVQSSIRDAIGDLVAFTYGTNTIRQATWYLGGTNTVTTGSVTPTGVRTGYTVRVTRSWDVYYRNAIDGLVPRYALNGILVPDDPWGATVYRWGALDAIHGNQVWLFFDWDSYGALVHGDGLTHLPDASLGGFSDIPASGYLDSSKALGGVYSPSNDWSSVMNVATAQWDRLGFSTNLWHTNGLTWFEGETFTDNAPNGGFIVPTSELINTATLVQAYTVLHDLTDTLITDDTHLEWTAGGVSNYYTWTGTGVTWGNAKIMAQNSAVITTNMSNAEPLIGTSGYGIGRSNYQAKAYRRSSTMQIATNAASWHIYDAITNSADAYFIAETFDPWSGAGSNTFDGAVVLSTNWLYHSGLGAAATNSRSIALGWTNFPANVTGWCDEPATNASEGYVKTSDGASVTGGVFVLRWSPAFCKTAP